MIHDFAAGIFQDGKLPFMIGGEHLVSLGTVRAAADGSTQVLRSIATPISFSETPARYGAPPPELDQHRGADWL